MKQKRILLLASMALLMFGCKAQTSANQQATPAAAPAAVETPAVEKMSAQQLLESKLKKDMPYAELRKIVLADGWLPLKTPACKENVGGEAEICAELPELDACSGDGSCVMWFAEGTGVLLRVNAYGDSRHWNTSGRENEFSAKSWEFSPAAAVADKVACPAQKFEDFLTLFAGDKSLQTAFTKPLIKVEELVDDGEAGYGTRSVYVKKADYEDFNLAYLKDGFHATFNGDTGPKPISVDIKQENAVSYFVRFVYGVSEGNSYRFRKNSDCWYLDEDPEAPSP